MRIDTLPQWAATAIVSGPIFGSDEGEPGTPATTDNPPEPTPGDKAEEPVDNEDAVKAIRERDQLKAERDALAQEKTEREEAEAQALAATRSKEENQANQINQLTEENATLKAVNEQNLLDLAIFRNKKYEWNDANVVSKLIDKKNIKINAKTGEVDGVEDALKSLAKDHPYMLKAKDNGNGNSDESGPQFGVPGRPSGGTPGSGGDSSANQNKRRKMEDRFPVLRV